ICPRLGQSGPGSQCQGSGEGIANGSGKVPSLPNLKTFFIQLALYRSHQNCGTDHSAGNSIRLRPVLVVRTRDRPRNTLARFTPQIESSTPTPNQTSGKSLTAL